MTERTPVSETEEFETCPECNLLMPVGTYQDDCCIGTCPRMKSTAPSAKQERVPVLYGPEKQDYPGGPIYRVGSSTGANLPEQPFDKQERTCEHCGGRISSETTFDHPIPLFLPGRSFPSHQRFPIYRDGRAWPMIRNEHTPGTYAHFAQFVRSRHPSELLPEAWIAPRRAAWRV